VSQERESGLERKHLPALAEHLGIHFTPVGSMKLPPLFRRKAEPLAAGTVEVIIEVRSPRGVARGGGSPERDLQQRQLFEHRHERDER